LNAFGLKMTGRKNRRKHLGISLPEAGKPISATTEHNSLSLPYRYFQTSISLKAYQLVNNRSHNFGLQIFLIHEL